MDETKFDKTNKHERLKNLLKSAILDGEFKVGDRLPSQNELAAIYGVSPGTAREAVGLLVSENLLNRIHGKGTFVTDRKPMYRDIALVIPHLPSMGDARYRLGYEIINVLAGYIEDEAHNYNANIILYLSNDSVTRERENLESALDRGVDGIALCFLGRHENLPTLERIVDSGVPFVLIDRNVPEISARYVMTDNYVGAYRITRKLYKSGFPSVLHFTVLSEGVTSARERLDGYMGACRECGMEPAVVELPTVGDWSAAECEATAYELAMSLLKERDTPFAVFATSAPVLSGVWQACQMLQIPHSGIGLGCFDEPVAGIDEDVLVVKAIQPLEQIGRTCVQFLMGQIAGGMPGPGVKIEPTLQVNGPLRNMPTQEL